MLKLIYVFKDAEKCPRCPEQQEPIVDEFAAENPHIQVEKIDFYDESMEAKREEFSMLGVPFFFAMDDDTIINHKFKSATKEELENLFK
jgi:hypothetical protein